MKIRHKNSREIIHSFPSYGKYHYSMYGVLILSWNLQVFFVYSDDDGIYCDNVTDDYEILDN